jgi:hypothetical protein
MYKRDKGKTELGRGITNRMEVVQATGEGVGTCGNIIKGHWVPNGYV